MSTHQPSGYALAFLGPQRVPVIDVVGSLPSKITYSRELRKPASATVEWEDANEDVMEHVLLKENTVLTIVFAYDSGQYFEDTFIVKTVSGEFAGGSSLTLTAYDKSVGLDIPSTDVYNDILVSELAILLADMLGLEANVFETKVRYETISISGSTFGQTLRDLAADEDFEFEVRKDTLYLGPVRRTGAADYVFAYKMLDIEGSFPLLSLSWGKVAITLLAGTDRQVKATAPTTEQFTAQLASVYGTKSYDPQDGKLHISVGDGPQGYSISDIGAAVDMGGPSGMINTTPVAMKITEEALIKKIGSGGKLPSGMVNTTPLSVPGYTVTTPEERQRIGATISYDEALYDTVIKGLTTDNGVQSLAITADYIAKQDEALAADLKKMKDLHDAGAMSDEEFQMYRSATYEVQQQNDRNARASLALTYYGMQLMEANELNKNAHVVEILPITDKTLLAERNIARAKSVRWKERTVEVAVVGVVPRVGERFMTIGLLDEWAGPWLIQSVKIEGDMTDLSVSLSAGAPKPPKKDMSAAEKAALELARAEAMRATISKVAGVKTRSEGKLLITAGQDTDTSINGLMARARGAIPESITSANIEFDEQAFTKVFEGLKTSEGGASYLMIVDAGLQMKTDELNKDAANVKAAMEQMPGGLNNAEWAQYQNNVEEAKQQHQRDARIAMAATYYGLRLDEAPPPAGSTGAPKAATTESTQDAVMAAIENMEE